MKRVKRKVQSARVVFHERREKSKFIVCTNCGTILHGMPRATSAELKKFSATEKKPNRPFAGNLCAECTRQIFRERARLV